MCLVVIVVVVDEEVVMIDVVVFDVFGDLVFKESRMCLFFVLLGVSKVRERSQNLCFRETQIV